MNVEKLFKLVANDTLKNGVCRVCLEENENLFNIFDSSYSDYSPVSKLFEEFFSSTITQDDGYPEVVCPNCLEKAIKAVEFKKKFSKAYQPPPLDDIDPQGVYLIVQNDNGECFQYLLQDVKKEPTRDAPSVVMPPDPTVFQDKKVFCQNCGIPFFTMRALSLHMESCLRCDICNATHTNIADLKIHKDMHRRANESLCPECGDMLKHGYHNLDNFKYPCHICNFVYPCTIFLKQHMKLDHENGNANKRKSEHYKESKCANISLGPKGYKCDLCDKSFNTLLKANVHILSMNCIYVCDICGVIYKVKSQMKLHMMDKHLDLRPFLCCVCGKSFVKRGMLKSHQQVHRQEKKFQCDVCHKRFVSAATLRYHSRLHTGEKPYICSLCGEGFVKCSRLREHEQKHHIGKLQCPTCMTTFSQRCSLKTHMDRFHPNTYDRKCNYVMSQNTQQITETNQVILNDDGIFFSDLGSMFTIHIAED